MLLVDKKANWESFMKGPKFGKDVYFALIIFAQNINIEVEIIQRYEFLVKNNVVSTINPTKQLDTIKINQHLTLHRIARLMIIIETLIMMCSALSKGYSTLPSIMTFYNYEMLDLAFRKIKNRKFNMEKILGFPQTKYLNLTKNEKKILWCRYVKSSNAFYNSLVRMIDFYQSFRIIYGKSKHGLALMYGGYHATTNTSMTFENSNLVAFDRRPRNKMPPKTFFLKKNKNIQIPTKWFHTQSFMKISQKLLDEINILAKDVKLYSVYIQRNHLLYAKNCGFDYLPYADSPNIKSHGYFPGKKSSKKEEKVIKKLILNILPNMNDLKKGVQYDLKAGPKRFLKSLKNDMVTNFFVE